MFSLETSSDFLAELERAASCKMAAEEVERQRLIYFPTRRLISVIGAAHSNFWLSRSLCVGL